MSKYISMVAKIIKTAMMRGEAKVGPYRAVYSKNGLFNEDILELYHYGTLIFRGKQGVVLTLGGWSKSDAGAISTAMHVLNIFGYPSRSQKVGRGRKEINGWYIID